MANSKNLKKVINKTKKEAKKVDKFPKNSLSAIFSKRKDVDLSNFKPKIAVIGVGGGGGNAVNAVIESGIEDVLTITYNTDAQVLKYAKSDIVMQLGPELTKGHGAGANYEVGRLSAIESEKEIREHLDGVHVAFVVAGMGGGTGTGAGPEIAKIALDMGILTIGLVTTPFEFEGEQRTNAAKKGLSNFEKTSDVLIVISNQNLFKMASEETTFLNAFKLTDDVLCSGLRSFIFTIKEPSRINVDIADFFTVMKGKQCRARMGCGVASGENRGVLAAQEAMSSPLLELGDMISKNIDAVIICIRCGKDTTLSEINKSVEFVRNSISKQANIIFGATVDNSMEGKIEVAVFATLLNKMNDKEIKKDVVNDSIDKSEVRNRVSFEDLVESIDESDIIGRPHSMAINEDSEEYKDEEEESWIEKIISFFKRKNK